MTEDSGKVKGKPPVTFTLDGVEHTVEDRRQLAADVLRLEGLDPANYDLLRVIGKEQGAAVPRPGGGAARARRAVPVLLHRPNPGGLGAPDART